jgi:glycosyltransferase involved in cell wall biosynthesis
MVRRDLKKTDINPKKVLFVLTRLLGGSTFSRQVIAAVSDIRVVKPKYVFLDYEDYRRYRTNGLIRVLRFEEAYIARRKCDLEVDRDFDWLFIQGFELILGFWDIIREKPTILSHDSTNMLSHKIISKSVPGLLNSIKSRVKASLKTPLYKGVLRNIDIFMPRTKCCASSLINDCNVESSRIILAHGGIDLSLWKPTENKSNPKPILLFVGNNFKLKGGELLLELFRGDIGDTCILRIVSNDDQLSKKALPPGVELIKGLRGETEALREIYRSSDLFVFPTTRDPMGLVLLEAAASGLPIIASDVAGQSDIVRDGLNGYLMPCQSSPSDWTGKILELLADRQRLIDLGRNSRTLAEERFSLSVFKEKLLEAFHGLPRENT